MMKSLWRQGYLGDVIDSLVAGVSVNSGENDDYCNYYVLKTSAISKGQFNLSEKKPVLPREVARLKCFLTENTILISRMNTPELVGECAYVAYGNSQIFLPDRIWQTDFRKDVHICAKWLNYLLSSSKYRSLIKNCATGTSNSMKNISKEQLLDLEIIYPPIKEQIAIAEALSDVDSLISSLQRLIEKKKAIKQGAMQELLTGKKRLPGFSGEWRTYKLSELGLFDKGCGISRAESNTGNFPAVRYGELYTKHTDYVRRYYSHISGEVAQTAKRVTFGDILFAASGETKEEIGICAAIVDRKDVFAGGDIVVFTPITEIHPIFFGTLLNMPFVQKQKSGRGQGDAVVHIHADNLSEIIVSMPEKNEQEAIAVVIKDFNDEIEQLEEKLAKYRQVKQGMMQELLTGRIRLVDEESHAQPKPQAVQEKRPQPAHNQYFDDAVVIAGIVNAFYSAKYPLGRKKVQKLLYLVRRKEQANTSAFHKKAAGPYADEVRYKGGEPIARKNQYIQVEKSNRGSRFGKGAQMQQALDYLRDWGKQADIDWLVSQFQYTKVDELELLATVDMAICDLRSEGKEVSVSAIKDLIGSNKEWRDKLKKDYFKDTDIRRAIERCKKLFPDKEG